MDIDPAQWRELNQAWWDERVPIHVASEHYDVAAFKGGRGTLEPIEIELLGDVAGLRLVHLQCHFGMDTMSWARRGASTVGLDFSPPAVDAANGIARELGLDARFVAADVYDAVGALGGERFDVVYTGIGALNWLPDIAAWASVVASLLKPGGRLLLNEFHPFTWIFGDGTRDIEQGYFSGPPFTWEDAGSYAEVDAATVHNATVEYQHTIADVLTALLGVGLVLREFREQDHTLFPRFDDLVEDEHGHFRLPPGVPDLPLMYALVAEAPA